MRIVIFSMLCLWPTTLGVVQEYEGALAGDHGDGPPEASGAEFVSKDLASLGVGTSQNQLAAGARGLQSLQGYSARDEFVSKSLDGLASRAGQSYVGYLVGTRGQALSRPPRPQPQYAPLRQQFYLPPPMPRYIPNYEPAPIRIVRLQPRVTENPADMFKLEAIISKDGTIRRGRLFSLIDDLRYKLGGDQSIYSQPRVVSPIAPPPVFMTRLVPPPLTAQPIYYQPRVVGPIAPPPVFMTRLVRPPLTAQPIYTRLVAGQVPFPLTRQPTYTQVMAGPVLTAQSAQKSFIRPQQPYAQPQQPYAQPQQPYAQPQEPYAQPQQPYAQPQNAALNMSPSHQQEKTPQKIKRIVKAIVESSNKPEKERNTEKVIQDIMDVLNPDRHQQATQQGQQSAQLDHLSQQDVDKVVNTVAESTIGPHGEHVSKQLIQDAVQMLDKEVLAEIVDRLVTNYRNGVLSDPGSSTNGQGSDRVLQNLQRAVYSEIKNKMGPVMSHVLQSAVQQ